MKISMLGPCNVVMEFGPLDGAFVLVIFGSGFGVYVCWYVLAITSLFGRSDCCSRIEINSDGAMLALFVMPLGSL